MIFPQIRPFQSRFTTCYVAWNFTFDHHFFLLLSATLVALMLALAAVQLNALDYEYYDAEEEYLLEDRDSGYGGDSGGGINPLAAFIAPLAGLALLGAAAAVSINPVLVQLAVVNGGKKRRRRSLMTDPAIQKQMTDIQLLENFLNRETQFENQAELMTAQYLQCSGLTSGQNQV